MIRLRRPWDALGIAHRRHAAPGQNATAAPNAAKIAALLAEKWPDAVVELDHRNAYQLLVATILSAQSTDKMINTVTPALFAKYPDARALAQADPGRARAGDPLDRVLPQEGEEPASAMAQALVERHGGEVPATMEELVELPGVARKTANVVLGNALGKHEGVVVDTHVTRLVAAARPDDGDRSGEDRAGPDAAGAARAVDDASRTA